MAQQFKDTVEVSDGNAGVTIVLNGNRGAVYAGGGAKVGSVRLKDDAGNERVSIDASGLISVRNAAAGDVLTIDARVGSLIYRNAAGREVLRFLADRGTLELGAPDEAGSLTVRDAAGAGAIALTGAEARLRVGVTGRAGTAEIANAQDRPAIRLDGGAAGVTVGTAGQAGNLKVLNDAGGLLFQVTGGSATLRGSLIVGASQAKGEIAIMASNGKPAIHADGDAARLQLGNAGNAGDFVLLDNQAKPVLEANGLTATLSLGGEGKAGHAVLRNAKGEEVGRLSGQPAALFLGKAGSPGEIMLLNNNGQSSFSVDGGNGIVSVGTGSNRVVVDGSVGDIKLSGADCAEQFAIADAAGVEPGTVMVIAGAGTLRASRDPYDTRVAGVVSGAHGVRPGIVLNTRHGSGAGLPVALNGHVFCKVDAATAPIAVGDLLTTSSTPGHAMKACDPQRAFGAVLGKAMGAIQDGTGLIPVLVSLL
jgi:hypothetical protein